MSRVFTIETKAGSVFDTITQPIKATSLILRSITAHIIPAKFTGKYPYYLNVEIGNIIGSHYVIDDDPNALFFTIPLTPTYVYDDGGVINQITSTPNCSIPLTMSGDLPNGFYFRVRDPDGNLVLGPTDVINPLDANFKELMLIFEVL